MGGRDIPYDDPPTVVAWPVILDRRAAAGTVVRNILLRAYETFLVKNTDYAGDNPDPFVAFQTAADELDLTREQAWGVLYLKHHRAVMNYVRGGVLEAEAPEDRLLDMIVYIAILYAMTQQTEDTA